MSHNYDADTTRWIWFSGGETMPVTTAYEEVENVLTNRLKNALRTGEIINAPDWVSDLAACLALAVTMVEKHDRPGLTAFGHRELDRRIAERIAEKEREP